MTRDIDASQAQRLNAFVSYARGDVEFVERLVTALATRDIDVTIDRRSLPMAVEFQPELLDLIRRADTVLFVVSSRSVASPWCAWEIAQVVELHKRLVPVIIEAVPDAQVPEAARKINYVHFTEGAAHGAGFDERAEELARALKTDLPWTKEYTRIGEAARRWQERGGERSLLLRGPDLDEAQAWQDRHPLKAPALSPAHVAFLAASRADARARQRRIVVTAVAAAAVTTALAGLAYMQRSAAVTNAGLATANESRALAELSRTETSRGNTTRAIQLAVQGVETAQTAQVPADDAESALYEALWRHREVRQRKLEVEPRDGWFDPQTGHAIVLTDTHVLTLGADLETVDERPRRRIPGAGPPGELETRPIVEPQALTLEWSRDGQVLNLAVPGSSPGAPAMRVDRQALPFVPSRAWLVQGAETARAVLSGPETMEAGPRLAVVDRSGVSPLYFTRDDSIEIHPTGRIVSVCRPWSSGYFIDVDAPIAQPVPMQQYIKAATCDGYGRSFAYGQGHNVVVFIPSSNSGQIEQPTLVDAGTGIHRATLGGHASAVTAVDISADGARILTVTADGTVRLWQVLVGADDALVRRYGGTALDGTFPEDSKNGRLINGYGTPAYQSLMQQGGFLSAIKGYYEISTQKDDDLVLADSDHELMVFNATRLDAPVLRTVLASPLVDRAHRKGADHFFTADESGDVVRRSTTDAAARVVASTRPEPILAMRWAGDATERLLVATATRVVAVDASSGRVEEVVRFPAGKAESVALSSDAVSYCAPQGDHLDSECTLVSFASRQTIAQLPCALPLQWEPRVNVAFCGSRVENLPALLDLADASKPVPVFPDARTIATTGLRSRAGVSIAPVAGCRRAFISLGGGIADDLYRGEGLLYDFESRRQLARTRGDPSTDYQGYGDGRGLPVFCTRQAVVQYARDVLTRLGTVR
jgi:hypothetical protein